MEDDTNEVSSHRALSSFTSAVGFALGELLLLTERPEELLEHLRSIHVTARATIMSSDTGGGRTTMRRPGVSLSVAALAAVRAWNATPQEPTALNDSMALLAEVLEEMGLLRMLEPPEEDGG